MPHRNIPIFIPHLGCPNQCVFCNQHSISGCRTFCEDTVKDRVEAALATSNPNATREIAFFGGSFTGIERGLMLRLLETAEQYVTEGRVDGIRLSTRPDYITDEILEILSRYSVHVIELGLQSMDNGVLTAARRGHTAEQAAAACRAVVDAGFTLVGQMMIGLPGSTPENEIATAEHICKLGASAARIYPTLVFSDTPLCSMMQNGDYLPLTVEEAALRSVEVLRVFCAHDVPCIRIGLCETDELAAPNTVMAGPHHPAFGEMVRSEYAYGQLLQALERDGALGQELVLQVPAREISRVVGQHRGNLKRLERETGTRVQKVIGSPDQTEIRPLVRQRI